jgi:hypothetical protein
VAQRLFKPFFTTRSAGTGLGLAAVQEIIRDHVGAMNVLVNRDMVAASKRGCPPRRETTPRSPVRRRRRLAAARLCSSSRANANGCCATRRCWRRWDTSRSGFVSRPTRSRHSTIDANVDALAEAGIAEVLRRPLVSVELLPPWRAACVRPVTNVTQFLGVEILL